TELLCRRSLLVSLRLCLVGVPVLIPVCVPGVPGVFDARRRGVGAGCPHLHARGPGASVLVLLPEPPGLLSLRQPVPRRLAAGPPPAEPAGERAAALS